MDNTTSTNIIKCRFARGGKPYGREYSYLTNEPVAVDDVVQANTKDGVATLIVTAVNVPEAEVEAFKDKLKYITGKKKNKPKPYGCETCDNSVACGEGDFICGEGTEKLVISGYAPAEDYLWCNGKKYK